MTGAADAGALAAGVAGLTCESRIRITFIIYKGRRPLEGASIPVISVTVMDSNKEINTRPQAYRRCRK